jgi:hypothetical protein
MQALIVTFDIWAKKVLDRVNNADNEMHEMLEFLMTFCGDDQFEVNQH